MKELTVREYATREGLSTTAVRKQIEKGRLATCRKNLGGKEIIHIIVDDGYQQTNKHEQPVILNQVDNHETSVQDAEIIKESNTFNLVSMETSTFEQLIQNIKSLADDRSKTEKEAYNKLEAEYFALKQEIKQLRETNETLKIESIQASAELKISQIRNKELEEKITRLEEGKTVLNEKLNNLEEQLKTFSTKESLWTRTRKL